MTLPHEESRFKALVDVIARLRAPDGCPWDRRQTHRSLREHLLSECYEVLESLDAGDVEGLRGELGDLLLQIVLHSRIAEEAGEFDIEEVIGELIEKLVYRHPHIFDSARADSAEQVAVNWEALKQDRREDGASMLDGVPAAMPALSYSLEVQKRVARVGFDWQDVGGVIEKLAEEVSELKEAESQQDKEEEFGDLLFTLANIARRLDVDPEAALRGANRRFRRRFSRMEELCRQRGMNLTELTFQRQNELWEEVKRGIDQNGRGEWI